MEARLAICYSRLCRLSLLYSQGKDCCSFQALTFFGLGCLHARSSVKLRSSSSRVVRVSPGVPVSVADRQMAFESEYDLNPEANPSCSPHLQDYTPLIVDRPPLSSNAHVMSN